MHYGLKTAVYFLILWPFDDRAMSLLIKVTSNKN